jgi:hypothetical protein
MSQTACPRDALEYAITLELGAAVLRTKADTIEPVNLVTDAQINDVELAEHSEAIRALCRRHVEDAVEIGWRLTEVKGRLGHGNWLPWLRTEFGWSDDTAERYMRMHEFVKFRSVPNLGSFEITALEKLAGPSTPEAVRQEALAKADDQVIGHASPVTPSQNSTLDP